MNIPYQSIASYPVSTSSATQWTSSSGLHVNAVGDNNDYIYTTTPDAEITFELQDVSAPNGCMVMGVELNFEATSVGADSELYGAVKRDQDKNGVQVCTFPRYSSSKKYRARQEVWDTHSIFLSNRPFSLSYGPGCSWSATENLSLNEWGVKKDSSSTELRIRRLYCRVYYRKKLTFDEISSSSSSAVFQFAEIEGIRWVPTDIDFHPNGRRDVSDYYFGWDRLTCLGSMKTLSEIRSGKADLTTGVVEYPSASIQLIDLDRFSFEDGNFSYKKNGYWSWITSYADRENFYFSNLADSTSTGYNTIKGLNPQDETNSLGSVIHVESISGSPAAGGTDSYLYIGSETIWYGSKSSSENETFGSGSLSGQLARGQFSSSNRPHVYNRITGVYPEISSHPKSWHGRMVRIWLIPLDPLTGFPLPIEYGTARSFVWATHDANRGPGESTINVSCATITSLLDKTLMDVEQATVNGITFAGNGSDVWVREEDENNNWLSSRILLESRYESPSDLVEYLNSIYDIQGRILKRSGTFLNPKAAFVFSYFGRSLRLSLVGVNDDWNYEVTSSADEFFNWPDEGTKPLEEKSIMDFISEKPLPVDFQSTGAFRLYVDQSVSDGWVNLFGSLTGRRAFDYGGKIFPGFKIGSGDKSQIRIALSDRITDSTGTYYKIGEVAGFKSGDEEDIACAAGENKKTISCMLIWRDCYTADILLSHLIGTGFSLPEIGIYDSVPYGASVSMNPAFVNVEGFRSGCEYLDRFGTRTIAIDNKKTFKDILESEIGLPVPVFLGQDKFGRLTILSDYTLSPADSSIPSIEDNSLIRNKSLRVGYRRENIVNKVTLKCDYDYTEDKYRTTLVATEPTSIQTYGERAITVENMGIKSGNFSGSHSTSADTLYGNFAAICRWLFYVRAWETPTISATLNSRGLSLYSGQPVSVSISGIQNVTNSKASGFDSMPCQIVKIDKDSTTGECRVDMVFDRYRRNSSRWAPSAIISSVDSSTQITVGGGDFVYSEPTDEPYKSKQYEYFSMGDSVAIIESNVKSARKSSYTISSVDYSNGVFSLSSLPAWVSTGDIVVFDNYSNCVQSQIDSGYCFLSFDNGFITGSIPQKTYGA